MGLLHGWQILSGGVKAKEANLELNFKKYLGIQCHCGLCSMFKDHYQVCALLVLEFF